MKKLLLAFSLFFTTPAFAAEITSKIVDSVQLSVQGAAVQSNRVGAQYTVAGTNINVTTLGAKPGKPIPAGKLAKAAKAKGKLGQRARQSSSLPQLTREIWSYHQ